jgi:DNA-binding beta-propeller fold protein YncE
MTKRQRPNDLSGHIIISPGPGPLPIRCGSEVTINGYVWESLIDQDDSSLCLTRVHTDDDYFIQLGIVSEEKTMAVEEALRELNDLRVSRDRELKISEYAEEPQDYNAALSAFIRLVSEKRLHLESLVAVTSKDVDVTTVDYSTSTTIKPGVLTDLDGRMLVWCPGVQESCTLSTKCTTSTCTARVKLDESPVFVRTLSTPDRGVFARPRGVAVGPVGEVYVVDTENDRVVLFGVGGKFENQWHGFNKPGGIAVSDGCVYVCDTGSNCVRVFDLVGKSQRHWGVYGCNEGEFNNPGCVAVLGGEVFVLDYFNHRVQVFGLDGSFVRMWGSWGVADGQLKNADGLAVSESEVFVSDTGNHRIQVFSLDGGFLRQWGVGDPVGLALSGDCLFVCDDLSEFVRVYETSGILLQEWDSAGSSLAVHGNEIIVCSEMNDSVKIFRK